jgi:Tol biopolymer transport system component/DNA-binding winged helix-turn-helix (wHTH) protein
MSSTASPLPSERERALGRCRLLPRELLVVGPSGRLSLEPRVMRVLMALAARDGATVTREELLDEAWQDRVVTDDAVHRAVSKLRAALASEPGLGLVVETVPRIGYRLQVEPPPTALAEPSEPERSAPAPGRDVTEPNLLSSSASPAQVEAVASDAPTGSAESSPEPATRPRVGRLIVAVLAIAAFGLLLALAQPWRSAPQSPPLHATATQPAPRPQWTALNMAPGLGHMPAFAPDGLQLVYSLGTPAGEQLWLHALASGSARPLSHTSGMDYAAAWSAHSGRIAFIRQERGECRVMLTDATGGEPRAISSCTPMNGRLAIAPDGRTVVLSDRPDPAQRANVLYTIDVDSGARRTLLSPPDHEGDYRPRWSPDGAWIAFTRVYARLHTRILRVRPDGGAPELLAEPPQYVHQLAWRGSDQLVYTQADADVNALWVLKPGGGARLLTTVGAGKPSIDVSADGRQLALSLTRQQRVNRRLRLGESAQPRLEVLPGALAAARDLALSPDGDRIAIESESLGEGGIWLQQGDEPPRKLWGVADSRITDLAWDPQGQRLAFELARGGDQDICHLGDERSPVCLSDPQHRAMAPAFSRDGQWLYYAQADGTDWYVYRARLDGSDARRVSEKQAVFARESEDGRFLLLRRRGQDGIWRIALDGSSESLLIEDAAFAQPRAFVPVGNGIFYVSRDNALVFFDYASAEREVLHRFEGYPPRSLNISPDQSEALFAQLVNEQADLSVLTNLESLIGKD